MFEDMGISARVPFDEAIPAFERWVGPLIESGEYLAWLAEDEGRVVAGAGLWLIAWPPTPQSLATTRGYVLNVYTLAEARGRGLARRLTETILAHCGSAGIEVVTLHASDQGRPIYESLGFAATNEMRINLELS